MARKFVDCREYPSDVRCTLRISGEEDEVLRAAIDHATRVHRETETPELTAWIKKSMKIE